MRTRARGTHKVSHFRAVHLCPRLCLEQLCGRHFVGELLELRCLLGALDAFLVIVYDADPTALLARTTA